MTRRQNSDFSDVAKIPLVFPSTQREEPHEDGANLPLVHVLGSLLDHFRRDGSADRYISLVAAWSPALALGPEKLKWLVVRGNLAMTFARRTVSCVVLGITCLLGGGSLFAFMLFLYIGPFELVNLGLGESAALWLNACLCLAFFLQHSLMIRSAFRKAIARFLPAEYDAAFFSIASGIVLLAMLVFWQESAHGLGEVQGTARLLLRGVYFLSLAGFAWGMGALGVFDPFGAIPLLDHLRGKKRPPAAFVVRGPYRWVRHPLYMFLILMFWSHPDVTADRLLFNVLWTVWMVIGTVLEERDLLVSFGDAYRDYQTEVPMLIPYRFPRSQRAGGG